jgi:hypothetical protein
VSVAGRERGRGGEKSLKKRAEREEDAPQGQGREPRRYPPRSVEWEIISKAV